MSELNYFELVSEWVKNLKQLEEMNPERAENYSNAISVLLNQAVEIEKNKNPSFAFDI